MVRLGSGVVLNYFRRWLTAVVQPVARRCRVFDHASRLTNSVVFSSQVHGSIQQWLLINLLCSVSSNVNGTVRSSISVINIFLFRWFGNLDYHDHGRLVLDGFVRGSPGRGCPERSGPGRNKSALNKSRDCDNLCQP